MRQGLFEVRENRKIARDVYWMELAGDASDVRRPGQFVNLQLDGLFLRRPISVCDRTEDGFVIVYKVVGTGTEQMAGMRPGAEIDILTGLGNGFDVEFSAERPLLAGGGMGAAPMLWLARALISAGRRPRAALGFQSATDVCLAEDLRELGVETVVATADGSEGTRGFVTDAMRNMQFDYVFACGPEPMLRAVSTGTDCPGQMSFEERMGCGFGACMGCTCKTIAGEKRICREGPVLFKEEVRW